MAGYPSSTGYPFLTTAASNVIRNFCFRKNQKCFYGGALLSGEFTGTMALD